MVIENPLIEETRDTQATRADPDPITEPVIEQPVIEETQDHSTDNATCSAAPLDVEFPQTSSCDILQSQSKAFNPRVTVKYENIYPWLYYSVTKGYICKFCEFWCTSSHQFGNPFVSGTKLGCHPARKLNKHEVSEMHCTAAKMYHGGFLQPNCSSVLDLIKKQSENMTEDKKKKTLAYIETLIKTAVFLIRKRWAISDNLNDVIQFLGTELGVTQISDYLSLNSSVKYTSHTSVQEIILAVSRTLEEETLDALKKAKWYSLLADESSDEGNREQFAILARFVNDGKISEVFLGLIPLQKSDAESLMTAIETFLLAKGIDITKAMFVGFDGCNTMSGVNTGKRC
jgi:hypothetical protein